MYGRLIVDDVMTEDIHLQSGDTSSLITAALQQNLHLDGEGLNKPIRVISTNPAH